LPEKIPEHVNFLRNKNTGTRKISPEKNTGTRKFPPKKRPMQFKSNGPSIYGFREWLGSNSTCSKKEQFIFSNRFTFSGNGLG
jgi:hypothetical protein